MGRTLELGRRAEELVAAQLRGLGWQILARNYRSYPGELDIVAFDAEQNKELVVVEVRCRTIGKMQSPTESVGPKKLHALVNTGLAFVEEYGWQGPWRIDLIGVTAVPGQPAEKWRLEHIKDITGGDYPL